MDNTVIDKEFFALLRNKIQRLVTLTNQKLSIGSLKRGHPFNQLNLAQFNTMLELFNHGECSMTDLAGLVCIKRANLTVVVNSLIKLGFVKKYHKSNNLKTLYVDLTPLGLQLNQERYDWFMDLFSNRLCTIMTKRELIKFFNSYDFLVSTLERY